MLYFSIEICPSNDMVYFSPHALFLQAWSQLLFKCLHFFSLNRLHTNARLAIHCRGSTYETITWPAHSSVPVNNGDSMNRFQEK